MIRILAREQWRFQRGYIVWAAAMVAAAVGFATFATLSAATAGARDRYSRQMTLQDAPFQGMAVLTDPGLYTPEPVEDWGTPMTSSGLKRVIDQSNAEGADAFTSATATIYLASGHSGVDAEQPAVFTFAQVAAVWGTPDWHALLARGEKPGPGEIALPGNTARFLGVDLGDTVHVGFSDDDEAGGQSFTSTGTVKVSGILYDVSPEVYFPAFVSAEALPSMIAAISASDPDYPQPLQATVGAQREVPALGSLTMYETGGSSARPTLTPWVLPWALAALFSVGAVVTAFTLGRTQAQSRVRWVATARALGARRAHLVSVAAWEWFLIGGVGSAVGIGVGWTASHRAHAQYMAKLAAPAPVTLESPAHMLTLLAVLGLVLAAAVIAVPSVIALRVPPTAALKETATADSVQLMRRRHLWPVAAFFGITWVATMVMAHFYSPHTENLYIACLFGAAASGIGVIVGACRKVVSATAARLARSRRPWAVHASMTMTGHPQQTAALATIQALVITGIAGVTISRDANSGSFGWVAYAPVSQMLWFRGLDAFLRDTIPAPLSVGAVVALLVATQIFAIAIAASARRVAWRETSTASALGLTDKAAARGDAFSWWIAQAHGIWIGASAGVVGIGGVWFASWTAVNHGVGSVYGLLPRQLLAVAVIVAISLVIAACVAALAALVLRPHRATDRAPAS